MNARHRRLLQQNMRDYNEKLPNVGVASWVAPLLVIIAALVVSVYVSLKNLKKQVIDDE